MDFSETAIHGRDKSEAYRWKIIDEPGVPRWIDKTSLEVWGVDKATFTRNEHEPYQRWGKLNESTITLISSSFRWIAFGSLSVAERMHEGKVRLFIFDGMHRWLAAMRVSKIKMLPCMVFRTEDVKEEAGAFLAANTARKSVSAISKFNAACMAGDENALFVMDCFKRFGLKVGESNSGGVVCCVAKCLQLASAHQVDFLHVLVVASDLSSAAGIALKDDLMSGLWYVHRNCGDGLTDRRLLQRLHLKGAHALNASILRSKGYHGKGGEAICGEGILVELNKGLQRKFVLGKEAASVDTH